MYKSCNCWQVYYNEHSLIVPYNISMATDNHFELIGLQHSKSYLVNVTAENAKGEGLPSDPILLQTTSPSNGRQHIPRQQWGEGVWSVTLDPLSDNSHALTTGQSMCMCTYYTIVTVITQNCTVCPHNQTMCPCGTQPDDVSMWHTTRRCV